ncbi:C-type lectin domain family 12 member A [Erethizon dorsatum]
MSEEVTYAHLKLPESRKTENIQKLDRFGTKGFCSGSPFLVSLDIFLSLLILLSTAPPASSHVWRQTALTLTLICLLLLIGLGILGSIFYTTLKTETEKLNKLQNAKEELQRNISLQLITNINKSENIRNLSISLQNLATKLCRELNRKVTGHKCKPCPKNWMWYKNNCYFLSEMSQTWQDSEISCSSLNASLLQIKERSTLEFVKSRRLYYYWLGLSPKQEDQYSEEVDENIISSARLERNMNDINKMYCGYIYGTRVSYTRCTQKYNIACEKKANPVKAESMVCPWDIHWPAESEQMKGNRLENDTTSLGMQRATLGSWLQNEKTLGQEASGLQSAHADPEPTCNVNEREKML